MHSIAARIVLVTISVLLAFAGIELLVRLIGRDEPLVWQPDPEIGWWHIPGATRHWTEEGDGRIEINRLGMRDVERSLDKPPGVFRIGVFGDSMTEAVQVNLDQTFCQLLERELRSKGYRVEVLNFGVNGYSPLQEYLLYQRYGRKFGLDLVVHAVFLDNDVAELHPGLTAGQIGAPLVVAVTGGKLVIDRSAAEASYRSFNSQPLSTVRRLSATYRWFSGARRKLAEATRFRRSLSSSQEIPRRFMLYAPSILPKWDEAWTTLDGVITAFSEEVRAQGATYAILNVPAGHVVSDGGWAKMLALYPAMRERQWDLSGPSRRLGELAAKHQIKLIDPHTAFRQASKQALLFFEQTHHMTPQGHTAMAAALETALKGEGLLPAPALYTKTTTTR